MAELEKEEKEKDWYYAQLQNLTKRIDSLPLTENVSFCVSCAHIHVHVHVPGNEFTYINDELYAQAVTVRFGLSVPFIINHCLAKCIIIMKCELN